MAQNKCLPKYLGDLFLSDLELCFANVIFFFLWPPYAPAQVNGGSWNFYTWCTLSVNREVTTSIFSWSSDLRLQSGPKSDEIWHIFRPRPQTFCSHARTRQNIVILKKNLSTDGCSTRVPGLVNFGLQTPEIHASYDCFFLEIWPDHIH